MEERMMLWAYLVFSAWSAYQFFRRRGVFGWRFLGGVVLVGGISAAGLFWPEHRAPAFYLGTAGFLAFLLVPGVLVGLARRAAGRGNFRAAQCLLGLALVTAPATFLRTERELYRAASSEEGAAALHLAEKVRSRVRAGEGHGPIPTTICLVLTVLFVHGLVSTLGDTRSAFTLLLAGANHLPLVREGEWFRLFSAMFLHSGWLHLVLNATALWIVGRWVEPDLGPARTWLVFVLGGLAGNAVSLAAAAQSSIPLPSVGASGGVLALLGAVIPLTLARRPSPARSSRLEATIVIVAATLFLGLVEPVIDDGAHLGGLLTGAALGLFFTKRRLPDLKVRIAAVLLLGLAVTAAGLAVASERRWRSDRTFSGEAFTFEGPAFLRAATEPEGLVLSLPPLVEVHAGLFDARSATRSPGDLVPASAPAGWTAWRGLRDSPDGTGVEVVYRRRWPGAGRTVQLAFFFAEDDPGLVRRVVTPVVGSFRLR